jgi:membrane protein implicated in regulation of membrane protease activity
MRDALEILAVGVTTLVILLVMAAYSNRPWIVAGGVCVLIALWLAWFWTRGSSRSDGSGDGRTQ